MKPTFRSAGFELVRYFPRQLITAVDMRAEQEFFREKMRRHNRYLHGWGVVCGCEVKPPTVQDPKRLVTVGEGYLITPRGDEIYLPGDLTFDLAGDWRQSPEACQQGTPCSPACGTTADTGKKVYLAACYAECNTRPVRIHTAGCGCEDAACEFSRVRESFELIRLDEPPRSHLDLPDVEKQWKEWAKTNRTKAAALPDCPVWAEEDCVVLATITLPADKNQKILAGDITYDSRRVLFSVSMLTALKA